MKGSVIVGYHTEGCINVGLICKLEISLVQFTYCTRKNTYIMVGVSLVTVR
jgi:hypothetical protein